ncbi:hypothetical protein [Pandoraea anhela]|uniref:Uncharacterized protein n=1 Tax=Pandoraea anhela TaxID=2508295 RepID=A0A5E4S207_9BURK|nr:hypothetical protein [Pandoraea anhela]VVD68664.1 hypothetical protein PAN31108_00501 [Pandoraea anhela]
MPPRHVIPHTSGSRRTRVNAVDRARRAAWRHLALATLLAFGLLAVSALPHAQVQSIPPATATPLDAFHQPCVAVRTEPMTPEASVGATRTSRRTPAQDAHVGQPVRKRYVDLDNRCATPPAFAPTRDIDATAVWHVDAPVGVLTRPPRHLGALALHSMAS